MKKYPITLLIILSITIAGCRKSNEEKAKDAIKTYLNENLDDMSTYEPVKFGDLDTLKALDLTGTTLENSKHSSLYFEMFHSYRIKGSDGAKYLTKDYFVFNSKIEVINRRPYSSTHFQLPELPANWLAPEDTAAAQ